MRTSARATNLGDGFQSLSIFNAAPGISAAHFSIDDVEDYGDYTLSVLKLPLRHEFDRLAWGNALHTELTLGYSKVEQTLGVRLNSPDVTEADVTVQTFTALLGAGVTVPLSQGWVVRPIANLGYSRITDSANTSGPDADLLEAAAQDILFDVDIEALLYGAAVEFEYDDTLGGDINLNSRIRYQHLWDDVISASDDALESNSEFGIFTARAEADGPTNAQLLGRDLRWIGFTSMTWLPGDQADDLGFEAFVEIGGGIELVDRSVVRGIEGISLRGSILAGDNVTG